MAKFGLEFVPFSKVLLVSFYQNYIQIPSQGEII